MQRRSSIAIAWRKMLTLGLRSVKASSSRLKTRKKTSRRGTITLATVSHTPMKWMVGQRVEVMRANWAARSNLSFAQRPVLVEADVLHVLDVVAVPGAGILLVGDEAASLRGSPAPARSVPTLWISPASTRTV